VSARKSLGAVGRPAAEAAEVRRSLLTYANVAAWLPLVTGAGQRVHRWSWCGTWEAGRHRQVENTPGPSLIRGYCVLGEAQKGSKSRPST